MNHSHGCAAMHAKSFARMPPNGSNRDFDRRKPMPAGFRWPFMRMSLIRFILACTLHQKNDPIIGAFYRISTKNRKKPERLLLKTRGME